MLLLSSLTLLFVPDLSADQLSLIRNWGGCEVIIGHDTNVTITPPSQCASGQTNDFTVQVTSSRST